MLEPRAHPQERADVVFVWTGAGVPEGGHTHTEQVATLQHLSEIKGTKVRIPLEL